MFLEISVRDGVTGFNGRQAAFPQKSLIANCIEKEKRSAFPKVGKLLFEDCNENRRSIDPIYRIV